MVHLWPPSRTVVLVAVIVAVVLAGAGTLVLPVEGSQTATPPQKLVEPKHGENVFWPYTSRSKSASGRTLAINLVVYGDADRVRSYLTRGRDATWNRTGEEWEDVAPDEGAGGSEQELGENTTVDEWAAATGSTRYLYVHDRALTREGANQTTRRPFRAMPYTGTLGTDPDGTWIAETDQLHDGTYFGARHHIRLYESPYETDNWVAIQAHSEHWDWFRLRHTVHGTEAAQDRVEAEFMGEQFVDGVWRLYLENGDGGDSDGWATVVDLIGGNAPDATPMLLGSAGLTVVVVARRRHGGSFGVGRLAGRRAAAGSVAARPPPLFRTVLARWLRSWDRLDRPQYVVALRGLSYVLLFASLFGLYLGIRFGGIFLEGTIPRTSPKVIAGSLYPLLAFGLPAAAFLAGRNLHQIRSFATAGLGIGTAIVLDYQYLAVTVLPLDVVLHRLGIVVALGFIAAGAVSRETPEPTVNRLFSVGVVLWVVLLVGALVGWV